MSHPQGLSVPENVAAGNRPLALWPDWAVRNLRLLALACWMFVLSSLAAVAAPSVTNVKFVQQPGTKLVSVSYDLSGGTCSVSLLVSNDNGATYNVPVKSVTGAVGNGVTSGTGKQIIWDAGTDWAGQHSNQIKMRVRAWDLTSDTGITFAPIPGGTYQIGNLIGNLIGDSDITDAAPVSVTLSPYYMAVHPTTKAEWDTVRTWAAANGYTDLAAGAGKALNHPVQMVKWYDVVKWANAASEKEGLTPCYKVSGTVVRTGSSAAVTCDWMANGYRLPTEAEWEVAARGGLSGKRFPWGDKISHSQANYCANSIIAYDLSGSVNDFHPTYKTGAMPYTSPVGSFAANGYGLYDIAGNVRQWCWDRYGTPYAGGGDPRGAASGSRRVLRGGDWSLNASFARSAYRNGNAPANFDINIGFRLDRGRL
jgi:formylglycine-generating enzyme